jgi:hypothetical protein
MITYPMSNRDALRVVMARVPAAGVKFICPVIQQFFDDEAAGHCDIEVKRRVNKYIPTDSTGTVQHEVLVRYRDPELEFERRLSC